MKITVNEQQFNIRRFTRLYITALSMVALLAIAGQIIVQYSLLQQSGDALVINTAGRQRMLSQKISKDALAIQITTDSARRDGYIQQMKDAVASWQQVQQGLQQGDSKLGLPGNNSGAIKQAFNTLQPVYETMAGAANGFLAQLNQQSGQTFSNNTQLAAFGQVILAQEPAYLTGMDNIVLQYQGESEGRITQLKTVEFSLLGLTLLVLLLEGLLVFRPAILKLKKSLSELMHAEEVVAARTKELESKNAELELAFAEAVAAHRKVMPHGRVIALGHYQIQGSQGNFYDVHMRDVKGSLFLECVCAMYQRYAICSHSLAAASLHSALLRQSQSPSQRRFNISSPNLEVKSS